MNDRYILVGHTPVAEPNLLKWAAWFSGADRRVAETRVGGARVSTVFLGLNDAFGGGTPLLFETIIFDSPSNKDYQRRYSTWDDAEAGHARAVAHLNTLDIARVEAETSA